LFYGSLLAALIAAALYIHKKYKLYLTEVAKIKFNNIIKTFKLLIKTRGAALGMTVSFFILSILVIGIIE
jgi:hypothetical protein